MAQAAALLQRQVLVLDRRWVPINLITARQALSLLLSCGVPNAPIQRAQPSSLDGFRAMWLNLSDMSTHTPASGWAVIARPPPEAASSEQRGVAGFIASPTLHIRVPEVIVLGSSAAPVLAARKPVSFARRLVMQRDSYRCAYCGAHASTVDHIVPRSLGGQTSFRNCVACCRACNSKKSSLPLRDSGLRLRRDVRLVQPDKDFLRSMQMLKFNTYWASLLETAQVDALGGASKPLP
jgi:5-methylcytosine-specific restriction endonuclease McrA